MENDKSPIYVTKPFLPELSELIPYLEKIWTSHHLTNAGPYHQEFEQALAQYLGVKYVSLFANGTLALLIGLQALQISGEVITTPFSFVATSNALIWNRLRPVFADVDPDTFNLDPDKIDKWITPETTAILPVHVFGVPCDLDRLGEIASKWNLRVVYDGAHAFDVRYRGRSVASYGDLTILSFHATKVFNTFEGGAVISNSFEMKQKIDQLKNFGLTGEISMNEPGLNGKMNEFQAALGIVQLKHVRDAIARRKRVHEYYSGALAACKGVKIPMARSHVDSNYSYFPILVDEDYRTTRDALYSHLQDNGIFARRYFYPLISDFPMYKEFSSSTSSNLEVARRIASQVLCLPMSPMLADPDLERICNLIV